MAREKLAVPQQSKSQRAYCWVKNRITSQEYPPGYRLVLDAIARELDMSAVPVREAIRQLEAEGLVSFERHIGARVAMVDDTQYRASMEALSILEGAATALAAPQISVERLSEAREINARMTESLVDFDPRSFTRLNYEFHFTLFSACPNARMLALVESEWARLGHLRDSTFSFVPGRAQDSVREHEHIVSLIERNAPVSEIEHASRMHRSTTLDVYLRHEHPEAATGSVTP